MPYFFLNKLNWDNNSDPDIRRLSLQKAKDKEPDWLSDDKTYHV